MRGISSEDNTTQQTQGYLAQCYNTVLLFGKLASHIELPIQVPAKPLLNQLPANVIGKAKEDNPNMWASATHMGDQDGVPGSQFQPSPAPVVATIW